jgi:hypothetical protein
MCVVRIAVLLGFVMTNDTVWACSCAGPSGLNILSNNAAVFAGKAIKVVYLQPDMNSSEPPIRVTFDVTEIWKGPIRNIVIVTTIYNKFSCEGYFFEEGRQYLVAAKTLAHDDANSNTAELEGIALCGGTSDLSDADSVLKELGKGQSARSAP